MPFFVVAYPSFSPAERAWIDRVRAKHDAAKHRLVPPHVTLVFGSSALGGDALASQVAAAARYVEPFVASFRELRAVRDSQSPASHVFLACEDGRDELVALHDRLYEGPLASELRSDIPYVPHVTIGEFGNMPGAVALAGELSAEPIDLRGRVDQLVVLSLEGDAVVATNAIALGLGAPNPVR
jgi:2'-5' RNA ligase